MPEQQPEQRHQPAWQRQQEQQPGRQPEQQLLPAWQLQQEPEQQQQAGQPEQQPVWLLLFCHKRKRRERSEQQRGASFSFGISLSIKIKYKQPKILLETGVHVDQRVILAVVVLPDQHFAALPQSKWKLQAE